VLKEAMGRLPKERSWAFLAAGSDGRDGEGAAGALVHDGLPAKLDDLHSALEGFSSGDLHRRLGALLKERPARTNVTDLYLAWSEA
ncbi:MAG: MOFRL family protein, partial [Myxococcota bacterium]